MEPTMPRLSLSACAALAALILSILMLSANTVAAKTCGHSWAVPGTYTITANFRGSVESAGARLTRDCRVRIQVPGIYSGAKVTRSGRCLRFRFKMEGVKRTYSARWCNTVGYIPWKGKRVRARVVLVKKLSSAGG